MTQGKYVTVIMPQPYKERITVVLKDRYRDGVTTCYEDIKGREYYQNYRNKRVYRDWFNRGDGQPKGDAREIDVELIIVDKF